MTPNTRGKIKQPFRHTQIKEHHLFPDKDCAPRLIYCTEYLHIMQHNIHSQMKQTKVINEPSYSCCRCILHRDTEVSNASHKVGVVYTLSKSLAMTCASGAQGKGQCKGVVLVLNFSLTLTQCGGQSCILSDTSRSQKGHE